MLPRHVIDENKAWEQTAAFHLERHIRHWLKEMARPDVTLVKLGRRLTHRFKTRHVVNCEKEFKIDKVHLSSDGYEQVCQKVPAWLLGRSAASVVAHPGPSRSLQVLWLVVLVDTVEHDDSKSNHINHINLAQKLMLFIFICALIMFSGRKRHLRGGQCCVCRM